MLVFRDSSVAERATAFADEVESLAGVVESQPGYDAAVELLITAGELESAVLDATEDLADEELERGLRDVTLTAARALAAAEATGWSRCASLCRGLRAVMRVMRVELADLLVRRRVPEGYAYYALYPDCYAAAARAFATARQPRRITVIGIRSIGTSLSAVVATELTRVATDLDVHSFTVRPHGHPFERVLHLSPAARRCVASRADGEFIVVDEGPGISGSSFASVAEALNAAGVPDDRIAFFPSWQPAPHQLRSERARNRWTRHSSFVTSFDDVWQDGRGIAALWDAHLIGDWSGGSWREQHVASAWPPVNPQHEQRKYLVRCGDSLAVLKFVGLGRYGRRRERIAEMLANAGYGPMVNGLQRGFLSLAFVPGEPLTREAIDDDVLAHFGEYAAFRGSLDVPRRGASVAELHEMIETNVPDELQRFPLAREVLGRVSDRMRGEHAVANDGRMLPQEWITGPNGLTKVDGVAHHDDHFLPGPQPAVWDLAGARAEFELSPDETRVMLDAFTRIAHEPDLAVRLPFYDAAYLALRVGYASMSAESCAATADGPRWQREEARYRERLRGVLAATEHAETACPA